MKKIQMKNSFLLLLTAAIWGVAFVAQSVGMEYVEPFTFNAVRSIIGGLVLIPCIWFLDRKKPRQEKTSQMRKQEWKMLLAGGVCCGVCLFAASNFQQFGIRYTTVGKAGFITACYIVIVPVIGIFLKKACGRLLWVSVAMAVVGLYFLCMTESLTVGKGDFLVFICALLFSLHILVIDYFSPRTDGVKMSCIQFFGDSYAVHRRAASCRYFCSLDSHSVCGYHVLRCGLYPADCRAEGDESYGGFSDTEPGVMHFCIGRLGNPGAEA